MFNFVNTDSATTTSIFTNVKYFLGHSFTVGMVRIDLIGIQIQRQFTEQFTVLGQIILQLSVSVCLILWKQVVERQLASQM